VHHEPCETVVGQKRRRRTRGQRRKAPRGGVRGWVRLAKCQTAENCHWDKAAGRLRLQRPSPLQNIKRGKGGWGPSSEWWGGNSKRLQRKQMVGAGEHEVGRGAGGLKWGAKTERVSREKENVKQATCPAQKPRDASKKKIRHGW